MCDSGCSSGSGASIYCAMSQHSFLGPTPAEDYDEEEADVVDGDCDDEPLTLGVFNLMPDVNAPPPGDPSRPAGDPTDGRLPRVRPPFLPSFGKTVARFPLKAGPDIRGAALPTDNEQAGPSAPRGSPLLASNDVSRYQMMAMDPSIAKAQLHSTVCPKTDATEKSLMKSTFAFFFEADLKGTYADGITVPLCYKGLLREFLVDVSDDIQDITH
ncbi:hypothetical protein HaLaN_31560, partial [Haematococcus lacustris]